MPKLTTLARRAATAAALAAAAGAVIFAGAPVASANADWEIVDTCTPGAGVSCVGGAPSYDGVPGLLVELSAQTGLSCWSTDWYLANDGRYYDYQCF